MLLGESEALPNRCFAAGAHDGGPNPIGNANLPGPYESLRVLNPSPATSNDRWVERLGQSQFTSYRRTSTPTSQVSDSDCSSRPRD